MTTDIQSAPASFGLVETMANRLGLGTSPQRLIPTLKATAFRTDKDVSDAQMVALLIVANQYDLNPFTKEIYAFPDKRGGIVPVVSVDGWARIINEHPQYNGAALVYDREEQAYTCTMFRKDRDHPTVITEYMSECARGTDPWKSHPRRMLRHKALIQCARIAFGFAGIYDDDEAHAVMTGHNAPPPPPNSLRSRRSVDPLPVVEEVQPEAAPEPTEPPEHPPTLADLLAQLDTVKGDTEAAALVADLARELPADERKAFASAFQQHTKEQQE